VSAQIMRRILVDHARRRHAGKRGDHAQHVTIDGAAVEAPARDEISVLELDRALERLQHVDAGLAQIVELRAFAGLTLEEAAIVMKVSPATAKREWRTAKAWLTRELGGPAMPS